MRIVITAVALLLAGCGSFSEFDTNPAVDANPACLVGPGMQGESIDCRRATGIETGGERETIDFGGAPKDERP